MTKKFKVWIKKHQIMRDIIYFEDNRDYGTPIIKYRDHPNKKTAQNKSLTATIPKNEGIILQYTGLKDLNGKEIYEGDIVHIHKFIQELGENMGICEGEKEFIAQIRFGSSGVSLTSKNEEDSGPIWAYGGFHEESFEIIGNIYENKDLLSKDNNDE